MQKNIFRFGNWIFVNFPYDNEIWSILNEKNIHPDDILVLQDSSSQLDALQQRWYKQNRTEIDREIREREEREANERRLRDEEQKYDEICKQKCSMMILFVCFSDDEWKK